MKGSVYMRVYQLSNGQYKVLVETSEETYYNTFETEVSLGAYLDAMKLDYAVMCKNVGRIVDCYLPIPRGK